MAAALTRGRLGEEGNFQCVVNGILVLYKVGERETALPRFGQCGVEGRHRLQDRQKGLLNA